MADEKKPKIDLKARLGKAQPAANATADGITAPTGAPSVVPTPGVPVPGFGQQPAAPAAPAVDGSDPFASSSATQAYAAPATIKIEMGEDVVAGQARASKKAAVVSAIVGVVGLGIGFAWGGRSSDAHGAQVAVEGAKQIAGDVEKSQAKIKELSEKIGAAIKDLKASKFPDAFANDLGGITIPFGADKLAGRNVGRFQPALLRTLFAYSSDIESLNDRKDALKNLFGGQKAAIGDALAAAANPKVSWVVFVQKSAHGPLASLAPVNPKEAFAYSEANWPAKFKISTGRELVDVERYATGDVVSTDPAKKILVVPVAPDSIATSFPNDVVMRISSELSKTAKVLGGGSSGSPDDDDEGVIKEGERLLTELKKIGN